MARRPSALLALALLVVSSSGCGQLLFKHDHRIEITTPRNYATVSQPVTISWTARDFVAPADGQFEVFLDRDPQAPGETLDVFHGSLRGVYETTNASYTFDAVPPQAGGDDTERNTHDLSVILVDGSGRRIGETAAYLQFTVSH